MANEPKFKAKQFVKVISPSSPYQNLAGHIEQLFKQEVGYRYQVVFEFPPALHKNRQQFTEAQLASMNEFFGRSWFKGRSTNLIKKIGSF
jgi:hypothetical protein